MTNEACLEKLHRVQNALPACLKRVIFLAVFSCPVIGQELINNGDFEGGRLPPWAASQVTGSSVALTGENSPFTDVYPAGKASLRLTDDNSDFEQPSVHQSFSPHDTILFGFDFKMFTTGDPTSWFVAWVGENDTTAFFFSLGGADGASVELNQQKIADLASNMWYHVEGWANAPGQKVEGSIVRADGVRNTFQGTFPFGVKSQFNSVIVSDGNAGPNDVLLDNFTSRLVTLNVASNAAGQQVITWGAPGFALQSSTSLAAGAMWTDVPGASGAFTNTFTDVRRFFRLTHQYRRMGAKTLSPTSCE